MWVKYEAEQIIRDNYTGEKTHKIIKTQMTRAETIKLYNQYVNDDYKGTMLFVNKWITQGILTKIDDVSTTTIRIYCI